MSDTRDPATDQQLPETNDRPFVQDLVITDIGARMQLGIRKYGTALQAGNGRNMLLDAYEEALDLAIYLRGALEEQQAGEPPRFHGPVVEVPPGLCWDDSGFNHPDGFRPRCELLAGHAGAHQCDRGSLGGTAVWTRGGGRLLAAPTDAASLADVSSVIRDYLTEHTDVSRPSFHATAITLALQEARP